MRTASALALLACLAAIAPPPAAAQRDCCFLGQSPPILDGARFAAGSWEEARERTERLGFTWSEPPPRSDDPYGYVYFQRGAIEWVPGPGQPYAELSGRALQPLVGSRMYPLCGTPPPFRPRWEDPHAEHSNTAIAIVGVIGLVGDPDDVTHRLRLQDSWWFGRESYERDLGARAREHEFDTGGFLRLMEPLAADAPCSAYMAADEGRWIGVVVECGSVVAAAAWLDAHQVAYMWVSRHEDALLVGPEESGGVMFEFVQHGWKPRA